eukprot:12771420-Alexandrium_andersonii.AAC.1
MSASLVGSEMCIRDRGARSNSGEAIWPTCKSSAKSWRIGLRAARRSVSYTHLTLPTICSV